jgi:hypothetical protein
MVARGLMAHRMHSFDWSGIDGRQWSTASLLSITVHFSQAPFYNALVMCVDGPTIHVPYQ